MSCVHSIFGCERCRFIGDRPQEVVAAGVPTRAPTPLPENRMTVETLQQMFEAQLAEVRRLVEENTRLRIEIDRLKAEGRAILFVDRAKLDDALVADLAADGIDIAPYATTTRTLGALTAADKLLLDNGRVVSAIAAAIPAHTGRIEAAGHHHACLEFADRR